MQFIQKIANLPNGIQLPYIAGGLSTQIPLLFVHGYGGSWMDFKLLLMELPEWMGSIAVTLRGHAGATITDNGYRLSQLASDLLLFVDSLNLDSVILVGGSSGGIVARHFALDHPDRTKALALISSPATLRGKPAIIDLWNSTISKLTDSTMPQFARDFNLSLVEDAVDQEFLEDIIRQSQRIPARIWRETLKSLLADKSLSRLHEIDVPCLIISGENDAVLPREDIDLLQSTITDLQTVIIPGRGHGLLWEDPQRVANSLVEFINETSLWIDAGKN